MPQPRRAAAARRPRRRSHGRAPPLRAAAPGRAEQVEEARRGRGSLPAGPMEALSQRCPLPAAQGCPRPGRGTVLLVSGSPGGERGQPGGKGRQPEPGGARRGKGEGVVSKRILGLFPPVLRGSGGCHQLRCCLGRVWFGLVFLFFFYFYFFVQCLVQARGV